jgi:putative glutamine amidotransferase
MTQSKTSNTPGSDAVGGEANQQTRNCELLTHIAGLAGASDAMSRLPSWYRPVVAIPTSIFTSQYGRWRVEGVESAIARALGDVSADAYFFPCRPIKRQENPFDAVWQVVRRADAVIIPGGLNEMHPGWWAHHPSPQKGTAEWDAWWEDWWRWHVTQVAILLCVPFLGIDQGAGYLNSVLGGTLHEDIRAEVKSYGQHLKGNFDANSWVFTALEVLAPESRIAACANGESHIWGACMHRQAVKDLAPDLVLTARGMDKCPEVFERADAHFGIGLQNHPEQSDVYETQQYPRNLLAMLCEAALVYASSQASRFAPGPDTLREEIWTYLRASESPHLLLNPTGAGSFEQAGESETTHETDRSDREQTTDAIHPL